MRRDLLTVGIAAAALAAVLAGVAGIAPVSAERLVDAYVLVVGALLLLALVRATGAAAGDAGASDFERALRPHPVRPARVSELESVERAVTLGSSTAFDLHARLRPVLREVAEHRLATGRGLRLDSGAANVREALGDDLWELLRPDRPPPTDRQARGLDPDRLAAHIDRLESL